LKQPAPIIAKNRYTTINYKPMLYNQLIVI